MSITTFLTITLGSTRLRLRYEREDVIIKSLKITHIPSALPPEQFSTNDPGWGFKRLNDLDPTPVLIRKDGSEVHYDHHNQPPGEKLLVTGHSRTEVHGEV